MTKITSKLVKDGNSTAVRLPKVALDMSGISGTVELIVKDGEIIIRKPKSARSNWAAFINADKPQLDKDLADWDALSGEAIE
jgi:antitoxin component of MazEF toxin-antitoxin module